ncbi:MAG: hypothetical protein IJ137_04750, partial [Eubacterium sp.]|nr:hypothetical protein [Eubacterium sp.]
GITNDEAIELEEIVCNYPKTVFDIDSFDGLFYGSVQLTWIRNWIEGTAVIITNEEAKKLDAAA